MGLVLASDLLGDALTAPLRFLAEVKRSWSQVGIRSPRTGLLGFGPGVYAAFFGRDVLFRLGFISTYFTLHGTSFEHSPTRYLALVLALTVGVKLSQSLDLVFVRMTCAQKPAYSSVRDAFFKIRNEEGIKKLLITGFGRRFQMLLVYYTMLICLRDVRQTSSSVKGLKLFTG